VNGYSQANGRYVAGSFVLTAYNHCVPVYYVKFQADGNLVVYRDNTDGSVSAIWESYTKGYAAGGWYTIQTDGNMVIYNAAGAPVWATNTRFLNGGNGLGGYVAMQADGNYVLYGNQTVGVTPVWSTHTNGM
jgi:hypothetical protein